MTSQTSSTLPAPVYSGNTTTCQAKGAPACADELVDIVHITGEKERFYVLTENESKELKAEIQRVQILMDELHQIVAQATHQTCKKSSVSNLACNCSYCKKAEWAKKAQGAGLLTLKKTKDEENTVPLSSEDYPGQRKELLEAKEFYENYDQWATLFKGHYGNALSQNWQVLKARKLAEINRKLSEIGSRPDAAQKKEDKESEEVETTANDGKPIKARSRGIEYSSTTTSKTINGVVEVLVFSQPDRRYYISLPFREKVTWRKSESTVLRNKMFSTGLAKELIKEIKNNIEEKAKKGSFGEVEKKISIWKSKDDNLLNTLHKEIGKFETDADDSSKYAISGEAHLLRFAAAASAKIKSFNPSSGDIDVGGKFEAAFSLAEGKVGVEGYFPQKGGQEIFIQYKNALGKDVRQSFGSFRLKGGMELSCFVGAKGAVEGNIELKIPLKFSKATTGSGAYALLGKPSVTFEGGAAKLTCEAFAGAQAGGKLSGCIEWLEPTSKAEEAVSCKSIGTKKEPAPDWETLAEMKVEGYAAAGIGASADFEVRLMRGKFVFFTKASAVFGPGAGGGFGTEIALDKICILIKFICTSLAEIDYRQLININEAAFIYATKILYKAALYPTRTVEEVIGANYKVMMDWLRSRRNLKHEAEVLTKSILDNNSVKLGNKKISFTVLPPETLGQMLWLLSETFVEEFSVSKEQAIIKLLKHIRRWRHFIEVLEHMTPDGSKGPSAIKSLDRLNKFLLANQKNQFNIFMEQLVLNGSPTTTGIVEPWTVGESWEYANTKARLVASIRNGSNFDYMV